MSACNQGSFEHLTRMDKGSIQSASADHLDANDLVLRVKVKGIELL